MLVSNAIGIEDRVSMIAMSCGAMASGMSGTGPAVGILVDKSHLHEFLLAFRPQVSAESTILCCDVRNGML